MRPHSPITGLIAAPFSPLRADGELNLAVIPRYAAHLARDSVRGAFICGTTGEGASLTTEERKKIAEAWISARQPGLSIIVHVGHNASAEAQGLARHAQREGADAIATLAPSFFRPANLADLLEWCAPIAAAAPKIPFFYYHMPSMAGADFAMAEFLPAAARRIPNFAGIKYTHDNLVDFGNTLDAAKTRHAVLAGRDEILLCYLALGATGAVGSTYNYAAPIYLRMIAAHAEGDFQAARKWQALIRAFIGVMHRCGGMGANKVIMKLVTDIDCGPTRSPLRTPSSAQVVQLRRELKAAGFFTGLAAAQAEQARLAEPV